jgi:hypothetical protein
LCFSDHSKSKLYIIVYISKNKTFIPTFKK